MTRSYLKKNGFLLLFGSLTFLAVHGQTNTLFNSLGGRPAGSDNILDVGPVAESFSTGATSQDLLNVGLDLTDGGVVGSGSISVSLYDSSTGVGSPVPGTPLVTLGDILDSQISASYQDFTISPTTPYLLAPNTRYWIVLTATDSSTAQWAYTFNASGTGVSSEYFNNSSGSMPAITGPYEMEVSAVTPTAVPEPSTTGMIVLALGLFGYSVLRRRLPV